MDELSFSPKFVNAYSKGDLIFEEGDLGSEMYAVLEGSVVISRQPLQGPEVMLQIARRGDVFGEMGLVENVSRSASARAEEDGTRVMVIDQAKFVYLVSQQPVFALDIMQVLCQRIRKAEERGAGQG